MFRKAFFQVLIVFFLLTVHSLPADDNCLSFAEFLKKVEAENPSLMAARDQIDAAEGQIKQAKCYPNPEIGFEFEKFGGNDEFSGTGKLENSISLSQNLITGGKQNKRIAIAKIEKSLAASEFAIERLQLLKKAADLWLRVFFLKKLSRIEDEFVSLIEKSTVAIQRKVEAGELPAIDGTRAMVESTAAKTELRRMQRELETLQFEMASLMGKTGSKISSTNQMPVLCVPGNPGSMAIEELLKNHPELTNARLKTQHAIAEHRLAHSETTPDITIEGGIGRERDGNKHHYFVGLSMPLMIFDRNQGNLQTKKAVKTSSENLLKQTFLSISTKMIELAKEVSSLAEELDNARNILVPSAREAFNQVEKAHEQGESGILELFDARRVMLEAEKTSLKLESDLMHNLAEYCLITDCQSFESHSTDKGQDK